MPTNNPYPQTSSPQTPRGASEATSKIAAGIERGGERIERTTEQVTNQAIDRVRKAREQATSGLVEQRDAVAERIRRFGGALRTSGQTLELDDPFAHTLLSGLSERAEGLAEYVSNASPSTLADDLQDFARRRPGVFFGGAFLIGLAVGRFVKSSGGAPQVEPTGYGEPDYRRSLGSSRQQVEPPPPASSTSLPYVSAGGSFGGSPSSGASVGSTGGYGSATSSSRPAYTPGVASPTPGVASPTPGVSSPLTSSPSPTGSEPRPTDRGEGSKS